MRTLKFILRKEFKQVFRDSAMIRMILAMPIIQLILLPLAADYEVKNVRIGIVDNDHSVYSGRLINKVTASGYFLLSGYAASYKNALQLIERDEADIILEIPRAFEKELVKENGATMFMAVNAINGT